MITDRYISLFSFERALLEELNELDGPADSPLKKYEVVQEGDILSIAL